MNIAWHDIILDSETPKNAWNDIFGSLQKLAQITTSPVALHEHTVIPDRVISETAWQLWHEYPNVAVRTSNELKNWCGQTTSTGKAVLILDALSIRELASLVAGAQRHGADPSIIRITGSECPSTTDSFANALGLQSRSALAHNGKPATFNLFHSSYNDVYTDVISIPFEDCSVPPASNVLIWHSWLDDLIHLQHKLPDQIYKTAESVLQSDGFWNFINKLRQGRKLVVTSDHGYAVSKMFSSEVSDTDAIDILKKTFGASRNKTASQQWQSQFMPPIVMTHNKQHVVMGQWKWKVQGGFPHVCHGGMSLLEVAVPWIEFNCI
ncbi:MAG: hypothetical protein HQK73_03845 [Desulfamplus sp.]|nr:hypothetical protein [Desulfamplus sp.]